MGGNVGGAVDGFEGTGFGFSAGGAAGISPGAFSVTNSVVVGVVDSFCVASSAVLIVVAEVDSSRAGAADVDSDDNKDSVVAVVAGDGVLSGTTGASEIFVVVSLVN